MKQTPAEPGPLWAVAWVTGLCFAVLLQVPPASAATDAQAPADVPVELRSGSPQPAAGETDKAAAQPTQSAARVPDHGPASADVQHVLESLQAWQSSFQSVRLTCCSLDRLEMSLQEASFPRDVEFDGESWGLRSQLWYEHAGRMYFEHALLINGAVQPLQAGAVDGFRYWLAIASENSQSQYSHIDILPLYPQPSPARFMLSRHPLAEHCQLSAIRGLWNESCCWIGDVLQERSPLTCLGQADVDGHACVVLQAVSRGARTAAEQTRETWWCDPEYQYLPRRYMRSQPAVTILGESRPLDLIWTASAYQQIDATWFPQRGTLTRHVLRGRGTRLVSQDVEWIISRVELNQPLPDQQLQPPPASAATASYVNEFEPDQTLQWYQWNSVWSQAARRLQATAAAESRRPDLSTLLVVSVLVVGTAVFAWQSGAAWFAWRRRARSAAPETVVAATGTGLSAAPLDPTAASKPA